jgi:hypothetical protein
MVLGHEGEPPQLLRGVRDWLIEDERLKASRRAPIRVEFLGPRGNDAHANGAIFVAQQARLVRDGEHVLEMHLVEERRSVAARLPGVTEKLR